MSLVRMKIGSYVCVCPPTGLNQAARGATSQGLGEMQEEAQRESCPFGRLATKLGLPANCDIDLRRQEELEVRAAEGKKPTGSGSDGF